MTLRRHVGQRIRHLREGKGLAQSELGAQPFVSAVEGGHKRVSLDQVEQFAAMLNVDALEIFNGALYAELFSERQKNEDLRRTLREVAPDLRSKWAKQRTENALRESE